MNKLGLFSILSFALLSTPAFAGPFVQGSFQQDDELASITFTVGFDETVTLNSLGYAGGISSNGSTVNAGGFDSVLSLFDSTGLLIAMNNDGPSAALDPVTGYGLDAWISMFLTAGNYTVALTQSDNLPVGPDLASGFTRTGQGNFTGPSYLGADGSFIDFSPAQRNGNWALDLNGESVTIATAPEPGALLTMGLGLAGIFFLRRRSPARQN